MINSNSPKMMMTFLRNHKREKVNFLYHQVHLQSKVIKVKVVLIPTP